MVLFIQSPDCRITGECDVRGFEGLPDPASQARTKRDCHSKSVPDCAILVFISPSRNNPEFNQVPLYDLKHDDRLLMDDCHPIGILLPIAMASKSDMF
jgi:hypothetical protein